jgi:hypothetical protein
LSDFRYAHIGRFKIFAGSFYSSGDYVIGWADTRLLLENVVKSIGAEMEYFRKIDDFTKIYWKTKFL